MRVRSVTRITLDEAVPVYDLTVPGTENFALAAGPFVHNSKDCSDALAGALWTLSQLQFSAPVPMIRHSAYAGDAWLPEQYQALMGGNDQAAKSVDLEQYEPVPFLRGSGPYGGPRGGGNGGGGGWGNGGGWR